MALQEGFEVKVPVFPPGQDPADLAKQNPELLKAAVRTSKSAVEFFLDALRPQAKDERAYQKIVEVQVLPLIAAMESKIEQAHFVRVVALRLHVGEEAVRAEVGKHPTLAGPEEEGVAPQMPEDSVLTPVEKKIGMLTFHFAPQSEIRRRLADILGETKAEELAQTLAPQAETLRFRFETELGEHTNEETVAEDMLKDIAAAVGKERFKSRFL